MTKLPHSKSCFVCGSRNAIGLKLRFETDGRLVQTTFTPQSQHNGFINVVHGGLLATLLDEVMVWGCAVQARQFSYCAEMTVRYLAPARPGETIFAQAELTENKRNRLFLAKGELKAKDGTILATSTGKYMPIKSVNLSAWIEDFEGTPEQLRDFLPPVTRPSDSDCGA